MAGRGNFFFGISALFVIGGYDRDALFFEMLGWIGITSFIIAHILLSFGWLQGNKLPYQCMQIVESICLGLSGFYDGFYQAPTLEVFWFIISSLAIRNILKRRWAVPPR